MEGERLPVSRCTLLSCQYLLKYCPEPRRAWLVSPSTVVVNIFCDILFALLHTKHFNSVGFLDLFLVDAPTFKVPQGSSENVGDDHIAAYQQAYWTSVASRDW